MTTTANSARQSPLYAGPADLGIANIADDVTFALPPKALLLEVEGVIVTAFNSATTTTLTVSDGSVTFINAVDAQAAAGTKYPSSASVGKYYPSGGTLTVSMAETGDAATAGRAMVTAKYIILDRQHESQD